MQHLQMNRFQSLCCAGIDSSVDSMGDKCTAREDTLIGSGCILKNPEQNLEQSLEQNLEQNLE